MRDVIVIGAGIGGAAHFLRQAGLRVTVIEKERLPLSVAGSGLHICPRSHPLCACCSKHVVLQ